MFTAAAQEASLGDGAVREVALWPHWRLVAVAGDQRLHLLDCCSLASLAVSPVTELCGDNKHIRWTDIWDEYLQHLNTSTSAPSGP